MKKRRNNIYGKNSVDLYFGFIIRKTGCTGKEEGMRLNMKTIKRLFFLALLLSVLTGCGQQEENATGKEYHIYYVDNDETKIFAESYLTETEDMRVLLDELIEKLSIRPDKMQYKAPLAKILNCLAIHGTADSLPLILMSTTKKWIPLKKS